MKPVQPNDTICSHTLCLPTPLLGKWVITTQLLTWPLARLPHQHDHSGLTLLAATSDDSVGASSCCRDKGFFTLQNVCVVLHTMVSWMFYERDRSGRNVTSRLIDRGVVRQMWPHRTRLLKKRGAQRNDSWCKGQGIDIICTCNYRYTGLEIIFEGPNTSIGTHQ